MPEVDAREPLRLGRGGNYFFDRNADERQRLDQQYHVMREDFWLWFDQALRLGRLSTDPAAACWSLLDVGCGEGQYVLDVVRHYPKVHAVGIDINRDGIEAASRSAARHSNVRFVVHDSREPMPRAIRPAGGFDLALGWLFLYFMPDPKRVLADIAGALGPGGVLLLCNVPEDVAAHPDPDFQELVDALVEAGRRVRMFHVARDVETWLDELGFGEISTVALTYPLGGASAQGQRWLAGVLGVLAGGRRAVVDVCRIMSGAEFDRKLESVAARPYLLQTGRHRFLVTLARRGAG